MSDQSTPPTPPSTSAKIKEELNKIPPTSDRNLMAALSYVWILSILLLIIRRNDAFIQHHAKQAFVLFIISLFSWIPVIGWIAGFLAFVCMVIGFINAWQGKEFQIPFIYGWSQKINF